MQPDATSRTGPLRNGNPRGNPNLAPRCGARTRTGCACRAPAMANGRCRMHGGNSTGPRTQEGRERLRAARTTHGGYGADTRAFLSSVNALLAQSQAPRSVTRARSPEAERSEGMNRALQPRARSPEAETSEGVNRALEQLGARSPEAQTSGGVNRALPPRGIPDAKPTAGRESQNPLQRERARRATPDGPTGFATPLQSRGEQPTNYATHNDPALLPHPPLEARRLIGQEKVAHARGIGVGSGATDSADTAAIQDLHFQRAGGGAVVRTYGRTGLLRHGRRVEGAGVGVNRWRSKDVPQVSLTALAR